MNRPKSNENQAGISTSARHKLQTYTMAASAAGVSVLALAAPAPAEIVYKPADIAISGNDTIPIDIDGDGVADFSLNAISDTTSSRFSDIIFARAAQSSNGFAAGGAPLARGVQIGYANQQFSSFGTIAQGRFNSPRSWFCSGQWSKVRARYLGLKFMISGQTHYGWAKMSETCHKGANIAVITGLAYDTIPNQSILAGKKKGKLEAESLNEGGPATPSGTPVREPATLGMLAKGASALDIWRRE